MKTKFNIDIVDQEVSNFKFTIKDTTGSETIVNIAGYSNNNSFSEEDIIEYVTFVKNLWTGKTIKNVYNNSENISSPITHIPFGEKVVIYPPEEECNEMGFTDGEYLITVYVISNINFEADFYKGSEVVNNFSSAETFGEYFDALFINGELYNIDSTVEDTILLSSKFTDDTDSYIFYGALKTEVKFLLDTALKEKLVETIGSIAQRDCPDKLDVASISEANLYLWASKEYSKKGDNESAHSYYDLANQLITKFNC